MLQQSEFEIFLHTIQVIIKLLLDVGLMYMPVFFSIGALIIMVIRYLLSRDASKLVYFVKSEVELISSHEDTESVYGKSKLKGDLVLFLKDKNVSPILYRSFGRIMRLWVCMEGHPHLLDMNNLQDIGKKTINEEFMSMFKKSTLPKIIHEVIKSEMKDKISNILLGLFIGIVIGFIATPFYLEYFKFIMILPRMLI